MPIIEPPAAEKPPQAVDEGLIVGRRGTPTITGRYP